MEREGRKRVGKERMAIILHGGTLDKLFSVLNLASAGAAMEMEVHVFFTFWGLQLLKKSYMKEADLPPEHRDLKAFIDKRIEEMGYPAPDEFLKEAKELGYVRIYACSQTMDMFNIGREDLIPEVDEVVGAASFLIIASEADITLFI